MYSAIAAITAALALPVLLGGVGLVLEVRQQFFSRRLAQHLLLQNDERERHGAIWDVIRGSERSRQGLATPRPPEKVEARGVPDVLLRWTFRVETGPESIVLESIRRDPPLDPGSAHRADIQALATSLRHYRLGQDLLHKAAIPYEPYQQRSERRLDSLLTSGALVEALDDQLRAKQAPPRYLFGSMPQREQQRWLDRLVEWRDGAYPRERSGMAELFGWRAARRDRVGRQERLYRRLCDELIESWADSLYTTDFLTLTDAWTLGGGYSALATREGEQWNGRAVLGSGEVVRFVIPVSASDVDEAGP